MIRGSDVDLITPMFHALNKIEAPPPEPSPTKCGTPCPDFEDAMCDKCGTFVKGQNCSQWTSCLKGDPGDWAREVMCGECEEVAGG